MRARTYRYVYFVSKGHMQISRYAAAHADHGVAFSDLLNTEADEGQPVTTHKIVPPFFKNKLHGTEMVQGTCPTI